LNRNSGASDARITKLEHRVANVERQNAELEHRVANVERQNAVLRATLTSERRTFRGTLAGIYANDDALYTGVAMTQHAAVCSTPECHVPLGMPGAVYKEDGKPHRIFATPFP
jgi:uncharacterized coiled-coil protein SlyX